MSDLKQVFVFFGGNFTDSSDMLVIQFAHLWKVCFHHLFDLDLEVLCRFYFLRLLSYWLLLLYRLLSWLLLLLLLYHKRLSLRRRHLLVEWFTMIGFFVVFLKLGICRELSAADLALAALNVSCSCFVLNKGVLWVEVLTTNHTHDYLLLLLWGLLARHLLFTWWLL